MSKPREKWWGYIKAVIRSYPELKRRYDELKEQSLSAPLTGMPAAHKVSSPTEQAALRQLNPTAQRELDAVSGAISRTGMMIDGDARLRMIDMVYWRRTHTLEGAALRVHVSTRTALTWHGEFVRLVAKLMGLDGRNE